MWPCREAEAAAREQASGAAVAAAEDRGRELESYEARTRKVGGMERAGCRFAHRLSYTLRTLSAVDWTSPVLLSIHGRATEHCRDGCSTATAAFVLSPCPLPATNSQLLHICSSRFSSCLVSSTVTLGTHILLCINGLTIADAGAGAV
jgi:hypothetical protein